MLSPKHILCIDDQNPESLGEDFKTIFPDALITAISSIEAAKDVLLSAAVTPDLWAIDSYSTKVRYQGITYFRTLAGFAVKHKKEKPQAVLLVSCDTNWAKFCKELADRENFISPDRVVIARVQALIQINEFLHIQNKETFNTGYLGESEDWSVHALFKTLWGAPIPTSPDDRGASFVSAQGRS